ncbi:hypothetical protein A6770_18980 [Nostoc minutum NIES-26]|uniref:DUF4386 domain-containing protein n=1 Tax=Nostoc minutum NIES-26 TaxID=1844469 RepID=A0A367R9W7_9NOSO|nr:hypothetical protein A6770_18980 [Nostoc minutum NIES-26]
MKDRVQLLRITGAVLTFLSISINIPYILLIQNFEYDDILRAPTNYILTKFHEGGSELIFTWFLFALLALLFIPASTFLQKVLTREDTVYLSAATLMGVLSGLLQSIGLMRWVFVVPVLADLYVQPTTDRATRSAVAVVFQAVHQYGGVVIGEHLGQTLLALWTLGVGVAMLGSPFFKSWIAWFGLFTVPLLILGQTELLATVIPSMPVWKVTPIGFMLWEVWLLITGVSLLLTANKYKSTDKTQQLSRI